MLAFCFFGLLLVEEIEREVAKEEEDKDEKDADEGDEQTDAEDCDEDESAEYNKYAVEGTQVEYSLKEDVATTRLRKPAPGIPVSRQHVGTSQEEGGEV